MNCERSDKRGYMQYICVVSVVVGAIVIEVSVLLRAYNNAKGGIMRLSRDWYVELSEWTACMWLQLSWRPIGGLKSSKLLSEWELNQLLSCDILLLSKTDGFHRLSPVRISWEKYSILHKCKVVCPYIWHARYDNKRNIVAFKSNDTLSSYRNIDGFLIAIIIVHLHFYTWINCLSVST